MIFSKYNELASKEKKPQNYQRNVGKYSKHAGIVLEYADCSVLFLCRKFEKLKTIRITNLLLMHLILDHKHSAVFRFSNLDCLERYIQI